MTNDPSLRSELRLIAAEAEVERTRGDLIHTIYEISELFQPNRIVSEVWDNVKEKGAELAENAVGAVKERPALIAGVMAGVAAFLAREPIMDAAGKAYDALTSPGEDKPQPATKAPAAKAPAPRKRPAKAAPKSKTTAPKAASPRRRPAKKVEKSS